MLRAMLAAVGGLAAAIVVILLVEFASHALYPPPEGFDPKNREALKAYIQSLPVEAFLMVLLAYALGSFSGGALSALVVRGKRSAFIVGGGLTAMGLYNLFAIPHPAWFWVASLALYVPFAWLGATVALRLKPPVTATAARGSAPRPPAP